MRKKHSKEFKAQVALEALKEEKTASEIGLIYEVHPDMVSEWKRQLLEHAADAFQLGRSHEEKETSKREEELYKEIGKLKIEVEFLKKKSRQIFGK
jgi:transposase-like protein